MKSNKNSIYFGLKIFLIIFICWPKFLLADTATLQDSLKVQILKNGSVRIVQRNELMMITVQPSILSEGWKQELFKHSENELGLNGIATLPDGAKVRVDSLVEIVPSGIHIKYALAPLKDTTALIAQTFITLNHGDWQGDPYQMGNQTGNVPVPQSGYIITEGNGLSLSLGPSHLLQKLSIRYQGDNQTHVVLKDSGNSASILGIKLNHNENGVQVWPWKAGEKKVFDFTLVFSRPIALETPADSLSANVVKADSQFWDANYLFVLSKLWVKDATKSSSEEKYYSGWFLWDTGSRLSAKPNEFAVTNDFVERLGLKLKQSQTLSLKTLYGNQNETWISDDELSNVGPIKIHMNIDNLKFENADLVGLNMPELTEINDNFFKDNDDEKVIGVFPLTLMKDYLMSMDYLNERIYLRPSDSDRRTFFDEKPLMEVEYYQKDNYIYCPVTINKLIKGYALLDSGNPHTILDGSKLNLFQNEIVSFRVGDYELMKPDSGFKPVINKDSSGSLNVSEQQVAIGNIGNDVLKFMFTTIDFKNHKIYFEEKN
jgi:hypothetical protein